MGNPAIADKAYFGPSLRGQSSVHRVSTELKEVNCVRVGIHTSLEIANYFIRQSNQENLEWLTPLLLEKMTVFADKFSLRTLNQRLINEAVSEDDFGVHFASLREQLRFYSQDSMITACFSGLPPFQDFLASKNKDAFCRLPEFGLQEMRVLNSVYNYVKKTNSDWYDLASNMSQHILILAENWGEGGDDAWA